MRKGDVCVRFASPDAVIYYDMFVPEAERHDSALARNKEALSSELRLWEGYLQKVTMTRPAFNSCFDFNFPPSFFSPPKAGTKLLPGRRLLLPGGRGRFPDCGHALSIRVRAAPFDNSPPKNQCVCSPLTAPPVVFAACQPSATLNWASTTTC